MKKKILIIDDDILSVSILEENLKSKGYTVRVLNTPLGASALILDMKPNLVLIDIEMPSLRGDTLINLLNKNSLSKDSQLVLLSGKDLPEMESAAARCGAHDFIQKSVDTDSVIGKIDQLLS